MYTQAIPTVYKGTLFKFRLLLLSLPEDAILHGMYKQVIHTMPSSICLMREDKSKNRSKNCINQEAANGLQGFSGLYKIKQWLEITGGSSHCSLIGTI